MKIEIDLNMGQIQEMVMDRIVREAVDYYIECKDLEFNEEDWHKRREKEKEAQRKRIMALIDKVDWTNAPDSLSQMAARSFFEKLVGMVR